MAGLVGSHDNVRTGDVFVQDFDKGAFLTIGAELTTKGDLFILKNIPGVSAPPGFPGIPVYFSMSDEGIDTKILPSVVIRRDAIIPALSRLHQGQTAYSVPAIGAHPVKVTNRITGETIAEGFDAYEIKSQAAPYDILYTIEIRARYRNNIQVESLKMLQYMMKKIQPYTRFTVIDSEEDTRYYDAFMETPTAVDIMPDIAGKESNFNLTLRVEAELDLNDPEVRKVLREPPNNRIFIK